MSTEHPEKTAKPGKPDDKPEKHWYFLDGAKYDSDTSTVTGVTLRGRLPAEKNGYAIYQEGHGNDPDRQIQDADVIPLDKKPRFYSVPPANFGAQ